MERRKEWRDTVKFTYRLVRGIIKEKGRVKKVIELLPRVIKRLPEKISKKNDVPETTIPDVYPFPGMVPSTTNSHPNADTYKLEPFEDSFEERQRAFLEVMAGRDGFFFQCATARALLGREARVSRKEVQLYVDRLDGREDCADFYTMHVIHGLLTDRNHPFLSKVQREMLKGALLRFKYWVDEPGNHAMIFWTENHQILFHAIEYLAGMLYPGEIFSNGKDGKWHMDHANKLATLWMSRRARWGYNEWGSSNYFAIDLEALLMLAEHAIDGDLARRAAISVDILLFLISLDLFHGYPAGTHGRAYESEILTGWRNDLASSIKITWGLGTFARDGYMAAMALASCKKFKPSTTIIKIGQAVEPTFLARERIGFTLQDAPRHGINPDGLDDIIFLWGTGAYTNPPVIDALVKAADAWNLWHTPFFNVLGDLNEIIPRSAKLKCITRDIDLESNRTLMGKVNKITWRTPEYMLSTAQDYRKGEMGNQHHIWQATLSHDAMVTTTNPGTTCYVKRDADGDNTDFTVGAIGKNEIITSRTPTYWAGHNRFPRAAQYRNLAMILYNINMKKAIGEREVNPFTHAFFPRWAFDDVREEGHWVAGRNGRGYVGLYSTIKPRWIDRGTTFEHDIVADGLQNAWICMCGNETEFGSFDGFTAKIFDSTTRFDGEEIKIWLEIDGFIDARFSWNGPFMVNNEIVDLGDYQRVDCTYCSVPFGSSTYKLSFKDSTLLLDVESLTRREGGNITP
ncbi:hypothetical protein GF325_07780 [Candidatus Bathyarchaeota archaeon]|nr:hypothetical protein [Candidatus Bathyarchaeota archaeon]